MKKILLSLALGVLFMSCVDDYTDARDPRPLDGPWGFVSVSGSIIKSSLSNSNIRYYMNPGESGTFSIGVVDAPGLISSVDATLSNIIQPGNIGTVSASVGSAEGSATGTVTVDYTASDALGSYSETITVVVSDQQSPAKTRSFEFVVRVIDGVCFSTQDLVGSYTAVTDGFDAEIGEDFTNLVEEDVTLVIRATVATDHPGNYRIAKGSFGLYTRQGYGEPAGNMRVCGNDITGFTNAQIDYTGSVNGDGTINVIWTSIYGDEGNTVLTPE